MQALKERLKMAAKKAGIDLIGFAGKERFAGLDARYNPFSIFPEAETVIVIGQRILRGALRGVEEGTNFMDYSSFGSAWLEDEFTALACYDLTCAIENEGYEAVPVFPNPPEVYGQGVSVREDGLKPNVAPDFTYAAIACGLGEIGMHGEFLSPQFGARQRFQMIVTDAALASDPISERSVCQRCGKCADICPLGAIDKTSIVETEICGKRITQYQVDIQLCKKCKNGAAPNRLHAGAKPDRLAALCLRSCMCELEEKKAVDSLFANAFRTRDTWAVDIYDKHAAVK